MNCKPLVTVALSTYNVAEYLPQMLDDVLSQTYSNLEVLCIDDASTDGTWEIIEEYAARDSRIKPLRQPENRGLAVSRTRALDLACGEWILMADGDDKIAPDLIEKAVNAAQAADADMVIWDYCEFVSPDEIPSAAGVPSKLHKVNPSDKLSLLRFMAFTWIRLVRTEVMRRLGITFPEGRTKQDIPAHWREILNIDRIALVPHRLSYYRLRPGATSTKHGHQLLDFPAVLDIAESDLRNSPLWDEFKGELFRQKLNALQCVYTFIKPEFKDEVQQLIKQELAGELGEYISAGSDVTLSQRLFFSKMKGNVAASLLYDSYTTVKDLARKLLRR